MKKQLKQLDGKFCACGHFATIKINEFYSCYKHKDKPKVPKQTKERFSGVSKSEHAGGFY
jgi:hypothetical protein